jgi:hypothetical protein
MEAVLLKAAEFALKNVTARLSAKTTPADMTRALSAHFDLIGRWSRSVKFKDMTQSKALFSTFVELDLSVLPRRQAIDAQHGTHTTLLQLTDVGGHIVLLGDVGAGKTTSLKRLVLYHVDLYRADPELSPIPLLVELRDLRTSETVCERILAELNVQHAITATQRSHRFSAEDIETRQSMARSTTVEILSRMRFRVFLDGLDEVSPASRALMLHDIRDLMSRTSNSALLMTCRSGDYDVELDHAQVFELRPLTEPQIDDFAKKWLKETDRASNFLRQLRQSPYADTAVRPLTLAHLCVLFERNGDIPDKPKTTYRKIIQLLLEDWDKQHSVTRTSAYASFGPDRKQEFLERLASIFARRGFHTRRFRRPIGASATTSACRNAKQRKWLARSNPTLVCLFKQVSRRTNSHIGLCTSTYAQSTSSATRSLPTPSVRSTHSRVSTHSPSLCQPPRRGSWRQCSFVALWNVWSLRPWILSFVAWLWSGRTSEKTLCLVAHCCCSIISYKMACRRRWFAR